MDKPFVIYRSSAGSGKTFTLALEYLKLALKQPASYRCILAVTFTNKATKEMKSRIVEFLYELSRGSGGVVREYLRQRITLTDQEMTDRAGSLLSQILHGYSYFSVMTIDSFFQKVIRAFARETGLQAGFSLELDQDKVLDEVVDTLLQELGSRNDDPLTEWLARFAEERVEEGKTWDFRKDIKNLAAELLKENYKVQEEAYRQLEQPVADNKTIFAHLRSIRKSFEKDMQQLGRRGLQQIEQFGLEVDDFSYKKSGVAGYFLRLTDKKDFDPKARVRQAVEHPEKWTSKSSKKQKDILMAVEGGLQDTLTEAVHYYDTHSRKYYSALQLQRFIYTYAILKDIDAKLTRYKKEHDVLLISDASMFLKNIIGRDETPFIYEKIGSHYQHFLIDEFQDTSGLQWNNFRPLVENSLDAGNYNLVVGDVKQAIYRWRGGDWQLLLEKIQQDIAPWRTEVRNLNRNYRSRENIVDFNNSLFHVLPDLIQQEMLSRLEEVQDVSIYEELAGRAQIIKEAYADAYQYLPEHAGNGDLWPGYVRIQLLKEEELEDEEGNKVEWKEKVREKLPELVENLQDQGYALRDIAFLVRNKRDGKMIADTLMDYKSEGKARSGYEYEIISPESLFLETSLSVGLLIDLLRFLDNPYHVLAKGNILYKYHKLKGEEVASDQLHRLFEAAGNKDDHDFELFYASLPAAFRQLRPYLNKLPMFELIENLIKIFGINQSTELAYLQAFQDAALEYTKSEKGDLHSFLEWWDEKGRHSSIQIPEQVNAMRILTIHKAKGLQFRVVVIPFCDWSLDHHTSQQNIIWTYTEEEPFQEMGLMPLKYSKELIRTVFSQDYYEEMLRAHLDNLNLLYVATTRAEECLYAFAAPKINKSGCPVNSISNALYMGLSREENPEGEGENNFLPLAGYWDESSFRFSLGTEPAGMQKVSSKQERMALKTYPSVGWRDRLMVQPKSQNFFIQKKAGERIEVNEAILVKDMLVSMKEAKDLSAVLEKVYFDRGISFREKEDLTRVMENILAIPEVGRWYAGGYDKVLLRPSFFTGKGRTVTPDRMMVKGEQVVVVGFCSEDGEKEKEISASAHTLKSAGYVQVEAYLFKINDRIVVRIA